MYSKDEYYIKKNFGKQEHFRVPESYFDTMAPRLFNKIESAAYRKAVQTHSNKPVARTVSWWHRYRAAAVSAVASILVGGLTLGALMHDSSRISSGSKQTKENVAASYPNLDAIMNYSMMDTEDMYSYIADSE